MKLLQSTAPKAGNTRALSLRRVLFIAGLTAVGVGLGLLSLLLTACAEPSLPNLALLLTYFSHPLLLTLNLIPCVLLVWLGYFLFGRSWCGALLSAVLGVLLPLINYYKVMLRGDVFLASDILLVRTAGGIMGHYSFSLTPPVLFSLVCLVLALAFCALLLRARSTRRVRLVGSLVCLALGAALYCGVYTNERVYEKTANDSLINVWSDTEVYLSRGFAVPFLRSVPDMLPQPPEGYNKSEARALLASYTDSDIPAGEKLTVVGVMLEAFCDLTDYPALASLDAVQEVYAPWHALEEESLSGDLLTNIFAGGTVDTEWGFLTGASRHEQYRSATSSFVRYFAAQGYETRYAHPGYSWFYNRRNVNDYLGFSQSTFTEDGFGALVDPTTAVYHSDDVLVDYLLAEVDAAASPLFSFAVSYQNHGPYGETEAAQTFLTSAETGWTETSCNILNNYLSGVSETVRAYVRLAEALEALDTPVALVLFGDHKPWLGNGGSVYDELGIDLDISGRDGFHNYFATPYLIWTNSAARAQLSIEEVGDGGDFSPCFLMARLFDHLGWEGPGFMQYQREVRETLPVLHTWGLYLRPDGTLSGELTPDERAVYLRYLSAQYYREHTLT